MRVLLAALLLFASFGALPAQAEECNLDSGVCGELVATATGLTAAAGAIAKDTANGAWAQAMEAGDAVLDCAGFQAGTACDQAAGEAVDCLQGTNEVCNNAIAQAEACAAVQGPCAPVWEAVLLAGRCVFLNDGSPCDEAVEDAQAAVAGCTSGESGGACAVAHEAVECALRPSPCEPFGVEDAVTACLNDPASPCDPVVACLIGDGVCEDAEAAVAGCLSHSLDSPCSVVWGVVDGNDPWAELIACLNGASGSPCDGPEQTVREMESTVFECTVNGGEFCPLPVGIVEDVAECLLEDLCGVDPTKPVRECAEDPECLPDLGGFVTDCFDDGVCDEVQNCTQPGRICDELRQQGVDTVDAVVALGLTVVDLAVELALKVLENLQKEVQECFDWGACGNAVEAVVDRVEDLADRI